MNNKKCKGKKYIHINKTKMLYIYRIFEIYTFFPSLIFMTII